LGLTLSLILFCKSVFMGRAAVSTTSEQQREPAAAADPWLTAKNALLRRCFPSIIFNFASGKAAAPFTAAVAGSYACVAVRSTSGYGGASKKDSIVQSKSE
jgi:hypothetical protein